MFSIIGGIATGVVNGVSSYFKGKQELKKAKIDAEKITIQAQADIQKAVALSKQKQAETGQLQDFDLDKIAMQNMEKSLKDEFLLALFSVPMILAFIPQMQDVALKGFEVIAKMPEWYQYTFIGMIVVIYGMRGLLKMVLSKNNINLGGSK